MIYRKRSLAAAAVSAFVLMASGNAHAIFRAYLSSTGSDANPCTVTQPCRLLPAALTVVDPGGEIWMLDSANYNTSTVTITKSVTILAIPGVLGSVVGNSGTAIAMNAASINVTLQNLNILSFNDTGDIGVVINNAGTVTIKDCNIFGFRGVISKTNGLGIWAPSGVNAPKINIIGTTVRNNFHGIVINGNASATISNSQVVHNPGAGIASNAGGTSVSTVTVTDTVSSNNGTGFVVTGSAGAFNSNMFVTRSVASNNVGSGFRVEGGITAFLVVGESVSTNNAVGFENTLLTTPNVFQSRGNNTVAANGADVVGIISSRAGN